MDCGGSAARIFLTRSQQSWALGGYHSPVSLNRGRVPDRPASPRVIALARWVSVVAHPFVTALVLAAAAESRRVGPAAAARTVGLVGALFVLPLVVLTARQVRRGAWSTVDASDPRERPVLFLVGAGGLLALLGYFARAHPGTPLVAGTAGVLVMVAVCAAVTPWVKLSLHMAAAALAASVLLGRGIAVGWLPAAALPVLGWSRVALGRHRWGEVALGAAVGACTGALVVRFG